MMTAFLFDGHIRNITNLDYDIYITFTISAALELPADLGRVLYKTKLIATFCYIAITKLKLIFPKISCPSLRLSTWAGGGHLASSFSWPASSWPLGEWGDIPIC